MTTALRMFAVLAALTAASLATGCNDGLKKNESNDILTEPEYVEQTNAKGEVEFHSALAFDRGRVGRSESKNFRVRHGGITPLKIKEVYLEIADEAGAFERMDGCDRVSQGIRSGGDLPAEVEGKCWFIIDGGPKSPFTLQDDAFRDYSIVHRPVAAGEVPAARLVVKTNVIDKLTVYADLSVVGGAPRIVMPHLISFPDPRVPASTSLIVRNQGSGVLTVRPPIIRWITPEYVNPATGHPEPEIRVEPADREFDWDIEPDKTETAFVDYTPKDDKADHAILQFPSNDPDSPSTEVIVTSTPVNSYLVVSPNPVIFDAQPGGDPVTLNVTFTNSGQRSLDVLGLTLEQPGEDYAMSGDQQRSFLLGGGTSRAVTISYSPRSLEGSEATLKVQTGQADNVPSDELDVRLVPRGDAVIAMEISPLALAFDDVAKGAAGVREITITNTGSAPLEISGVRLSDDSDGPALLPTDPEFTVSTGGEAGTLAAGDTRTIEITLTRGADDGLRHVGAVVIESGAPTSPDAVNLVSNPVLD